MASTMATRMQSTSRLRAQRFSLAFFDGPRLPPLRLQPAHLLPRLPPRRRRRVLRPHLQFRLVVDAPRPELQRLVLQLLPASAPGMMIICASGSAPDLAAP